MVVVHGGLLAFMSSVAMVGHRPRWPIHSLVESFKATLKIVTRLANICLTAS